jgi:hypothetical protein
MGCAEQSARWYEGFMLKTLCRSRQPNQHMKDFLANIPFYPSAVYSSKEYVFIICLANPLGIGCSTETIHTALHDVQLKMFNSGDFHNGDFGRGKPKQSTATASKSP